MMNQKEEELYLVDSSYYFHLKEIPTGFQYQVFDSNDRKLLAKDRITWEDMLENPIRNPIACARLLAFKDYGAEGLTVQKVALRTLDQFPEARRAYRKDHKQDGHDHSIRFINSSYDERFRIPDGGTIRTQYPDEVLIQKCEYIDDYHTKIGSNVFHICQFAELMERNGGVVEPEPEVLTDAAAWSIGTRGYLSIQECDDGWDYTVCDSSFHEIDGGQLDAPELSMIEARETILADLGWSTQTRIPADYEMVTERMEDASRSVLAELHSMKSDPKPVAGHAERKGQER